MSALHEPALNYKKIPLTLKKLAMTNPMYRATARIQHTVPTYRPIPDELAFLP